MTLPKAETVTFRLSLASPSSAALGAVMSRLADAGFTVEQEGRRGLSVSGPRQLTETVFNSPISYDRDTPHFTSDPKADIIPHSIDYRVYFPTEPTFY
jgi:hypothetical protein